jgi:hypothetical protein
MVHSRIFVLVELLQIALPDVHHDCIEMGSALTRNFSNGEKERLNKERQRRESVPNPNVDVGGAANRSILIVDLDCCLAERHFAKNLPLGRNQKLARLGTLEESGSPKHATWCCRHGISSF